MKSNTPKITVIILLLIFGLIVGYFAVNSYIKEQSKVSVALIDEQIEDQKKLVVGLAELTRQNNIDEIVGVAVKDCKAIERQRFDGLLDKLSGAISNSELSELDSLFYKCGSFYADGKSVMALRLTREVEILESLAELRSNISGESEFLATEITSWTKIAKDELKTAEYFSQLVTLQGTIITDLRSGKSSNSPEIKATLAQVNSTRDQMLFLSKQIELERAEVTNL